MFRLYTLLLLALFLVQCGQKFPVPKEQMEGEGQLSHLRQQYVEMMHRSAPGINWQVENDKAMQENYEAIQEKADAGAGVFANGNLRAQWVERGSNNQAGSTIGLDYVPATNMIYTISDGGSLWRRNLDANDWTNLNKSLRFRSRQIKVVSTPNGQRILAAIGKKIVYSDNEGQTFTEATGWNYYDNWGDPIQLEVTTNGTQVEIYYTVLTWSASPWGPRIQLYYSADYGQSFSLIQTFAHGNTSQISMWHPYGTGDCYLMNQSTKLYQLDGASLITMTTTNNLPTGVNCQLRGYRATNGNITFFALLDKDDVYRSTNNGVSWQLRGTMPSKAWSVGLEVSLSDANRLFYGEVNAFRSTDAGTSWNTVNEWWEYYGNVPGKLHADIMEIEFFRKSNNQEFALISNHGGLSVSYDFLQTTLNLSQTGLGISQYYDVRTDPTDPNYIYAGSQDQGYQRASNAVSSPGSILNFTQIVSGDYGHMVFSGNGTHFWKQYPGGDFGYHHEPKTSNNWNDSSWDLSGDHMPNVGWLVPTAEFSYQPALNKILVGGGNINGGTGSHLIELTAATTSPYTITATQDPYNFRTNSNNGESNISAIAMSALDGKRFVGTEDGTFFRKTLTGNWQKATGFDGPDGFYLYGSCILPSKLDANVVWFSGSGYSNAPVWKSVDGGQTFTAMASGLPGTLVQEMAASPDEKFLFAATDAGPYVYVAAENKWFSLLSPEVPLQTVYSVEYVASRKLVRFGTFGRGIWDFVMDDLVLDGTVYKSACGGSSGEIHLKPTGGFAPVTYLWSNGNTNTTLSALAPGTYTVTATDNNGLSSTQVFMVESGGKPIKPHDIQISTSPCMPVQINWAGPNAGTYQLRYKQGNAADWTFVGDVGSVKNKSLNVDAANGTALMVSVRYVCAGGTQSAWVSTTATLPLCQQEIAERGEISANENVMLYPNPARGSVTLKWAGEAPDQAVIQVYDLHGALLRNWQNISIPGDMQLPLDLSGLPAGIYWVAANRLKPLKLIVVD